MKKPNKKQITIAAVIAAIIIIVVILLCAKGCASEQADAGSIDSASIEQVAEGDSEDGQDDASTEEEAADRENAGEEDSGTAEAAGSSEGTGATNAQATDNGSAGGAPSAQAESSVGNRRWIEDTEQVWVPEPDTTEQVPRTVYKEVNVCNVCGNEIKGDVSAHAKQHMMAGQGSGHHPETRTETVYDTITHTGNGHWETRVTGGHWE